MLPRLAVCVLLLPGITILSAADPLRCHRVATQPGEADWSKSERALLERGSQGEALPLPPTEVRTLWSDSHLYVRFVCPFRELNLRPSPDPKKETFGLWNYDVAEVFAGSDFEHIGRYKEFEVSPQGDWVDLDVNWDRKGNETDWSWNSGFTSKASIDKAKQVWRCEMAIPLRSLGVERPAPGVRLRINFYRIEGKEPARLLMAWRPTGKRSFHVPAAFGELILSQ